MITNALELYLAAGGDRQGNHSTDEILASGATHIAMNSSNGVYTLQLLPDEFEPDFAYVNGGWCYGKSNCVPLHIIGYVSTESLEGVDRRKMCFPIDRDFTLETTK